MVMDLYMTRRQRVLTSVLGAGSGMIAIPLLMRTWAPTWAVISWTLTYVAITAIAWTVLWRTSLEVEQPWSIAVGILYGVLPISATLSAPDTKSYWIAGAVVMIFIASEVSTLPYVRIEEWRIGVVAAGMMLTIAGLYELGPLALAMLPVLGAIISSANHMRRTKTTLEQARARADAKTLEAEQLANIDDLTGLLNRRGIAAEIDRVAEGSHTLVMIDANRFKAVNDGHGYAAGDQVIQQIARAIRQRLGPAWLVGRQGGDEFVAVAHGVHDISDTVCAPVSCRVQVFGTTSSLQVSLSGGFVAYDGPDMVDRAISKASYAMRASKRKGVSLTQFDQNLSEQFDRMLEVTTPAGGELRSSALTAEYQVIVDTDSRIVGCEALARWQRPDGSLVPPEGFLQVLADNGQMPLLNEVMLAKGVSFAARFNGQPNAPFVAVNIGSPSLSSDDLVSTVTRLLNDHQVPAHRLMIELTESEGFGPSLAWEEASSALRELGVLLAIDDFGSGYSNLERLGQLPISYLKFDRSLTRAVSGPLGSVAKGVVDFAAQTGTGVIGEGIETAAELTSMRELGVELFQGFYFGHPIPADEIERQWIDAQQTRSDQAAPPRETVA